MRIYLVQHGAALSREQDPDRPLSEQGRRDMARMAEFLAGAAVAPDRIKHSGRTRARQTAEILGERLGGTVSQSRWPLAPNDGPGDLVAATANWHDEVMMVGHMPFMGRAASLLIAGSRGAKAFAFMPGSVLCLERQEVGWSAAWMIRPELLP